MSGNVTVNPGAIGSSSEGLAREILDNSKILENARMRLQGWAKIRNEKGEEVMVQLEDRGYSKECVAWMMGKLEEIMNKNMYLSDLDNEEAMLLEARSIAMGFNEELWLHWKKFSLSVEQYKELCEMHRNYLSQTIRHPLKRGIRDLLTKTTNEQTMRSDQTVRESTEKRGGFFGLGGR